MVKSGIRTACILVVVLTTSLTTTRVWAQTPAEATRQALEALDQWLATSSEGPAWRQFLQTDRLRTQLDRGDGADRTILREVLGQCTSGVAGLDLEPFVRVRDNLAEWLTALPAPTVEQLPDEIRAAKSLFIPITPLSVQRAKGELTAAMDRLEAKLREAGTEGGKWREFLKLDTLRSQLAQTSPNLATLDSVYAQFASSYEGLGLVWFADVRQALLRYVVTARAVGNAKISGDYQRRLEDLAASLQSYRKDPSLDNALKISQDMAWLRMAGQAPWLVKEVRAAISSPNLFLQISDRLVSNRVGGPVDETAPVEDCILGTSIHGTGHVTGQLKAELVPSENEGIIDILFQGNIQSESVGYNGPATIYSSGNTALGARKRITVTPQEITSCPAQSNAQTSTDIHCIDTGGRALVERIAWSRAGKQKAEAEAVASEHAQQKFNQRMDDQAQTMIARGNEGLLQKLRRPLAERNLYPEVFRVSTTADALRIMAMITGDANLAAPTPPPALAGASDLAVRVHQSSINNLTATALAGRAIDEKRFNAIVAQFLGLPERIETTPDEENWGLTFAAPQPISVTFQQNEFSVTIRGSAYMNEGRDYPGMNVTAHYRIEKGPQGLHAVRQGPLEIFPPGFQPGSGQAMGARQQALRTVLQRRFGQFFTERLMPENIVVGKDTPKPVTLHLTRWETENGWLVMGWDSVPAGAR